VRERQAALLLEQCALLIALSEDYRNRVWEERNQIAVGVVAACDLGAYRLAQARLRILCREPRVLSAIDNLHETGTSLGKAWRVSPHDDDDVQAGWEAHKSAARAFADASSGLVQ
jgi:hypothetical protein